MGELMLMGMEHTHAIGISRPPTLIKKTYQNLEAIFSYFFSNIPQEIPKNFLFQSQCLYLVKV